MLDKNKNIEKIIATLSNQRIHLLSGFKYLLDIYHFSCCYLLTSIIITDQALKSFLQVIMSICCIVSTNPFKSNEVCEQPNEQAKLTQLNLLFLRLSILVSNFELQSL